MIKITRTLIATCEIKKDEKFLCIVRDGGRL